MTTIATVPIPEGVTVEVQPRAFKATANGKTNERSFKLRGMELAQEEQAITVKLKTVRRDTKAIAKSIAAHIKNMMLGVKDGFEVKLAVVHSHFPMNVTVKDDLIEIVNFLGEKKSRMARIMPGCEVQVKGKDVTVKGFNKEAVGQTAANMEKATRMTKRDRRRFQDGIYIVKKA
jgi:large subunit ribosomal protein L6